MSKLKNLFEWPFKARKNCNELGFQFVMAELEIGLMFCLRALNTKDERRAQYAANARSAYESAMWHVKVLILTTGERQVFENKERRLRTGIERM